MVTIRLRMKARGEERVARRGEKEEGEEEKVTEKEKQDSIDRRKLS